MTGRIDLYWGKNTIYVQLQALKKVKVKASCLVLN